MTNQITATYIDHMGSDLSVVNAARVSFGKSSQLVFTEDPDDYGSLSERDTKLIKFLARGCTSGDWDRLVGGLLDAASSSAIEETMNHLRHMPPHWTPFGHTAITLHIKAPLFVARQLGKHQVGFVWNEISRRYVDEEPEFYQPKLWRGRAVDKKQGSAGPVTTNADPEFLNHTALRTYNEMLEEGVAPEMARMVLPQSMMTEWYWTANLYGWSKMFISRTDPHTQKETQDVAHMIGDIIRPLFPVSWAELVSNS